MKQKTYLHWGVTITAAACAILVFYDTFFQDGVLFIFIEKLFGILKPVLYGLAMAYLLTPIVDFFDRLLRDRLGVKRAGLMRCLSILVTWLLALGLVYLLFSILIPERIAALFQSRELLPHHLHLGHAACGGQSLHLRACAHAGP